MNRLKQMRLYRSHLATEARSLADNYVKSSGTAPDTCPQVQARLNLLQQRMRTLNTEIDKLEAINYRRVDAQPHVQFATA